MPVNTIQVAILIVSYNHRDDLADCLPSLLVSQIRGISTSVTLVDNMSSDGTATFVRKKFPEVEVIEINENLGFAGGNNLGFKHIIKSKPETQYVVLLNPDTVVEPDWLLPMVEYMQTNTNVAIVQPKIRLYSTYTKSNKRINTAGNESHFLGFGFVTAFNEIDDGRFDTIRPIDFASGAAQMIRADLIQTHGLFDESMFMYLEDAELSWKMRQLGYQVVYIPKSVVYHKHDPDKTMKFFFYYLEKNRFWLLLNYYKIPTIFLICPAGFLLEIGMVCYSAINGNLRDKLQSYGFFLQWCNLKMLWKKRLKIQNRRKISDYVFVKNFVGTINFTPINKGVIRYLANPILGLYWEIIRKFLRW